MRESSLEQRQLEIIIRMAQIIRNIKKPGAINSSNNNRIKKKPLPLKNRKWFRLLIEFSKRNYPLSLKNCFYRLIVIPPLNQLNLSPSLRTLAIIAVMLISSPFRNSVHLNLTLLMLFQTLLQCTIL